MSAYDEDVILEAEFENSSLIRTPLALKGFAWR